MTQEPHKHAHYVTLLLALSYRPEAVKEEVEAQVGEKRKADHGEEPDCGREVLEDMSRALRGWVEGREWLHMRLCVSYRASVDSVSVQPELTQSAAILLAAACRWAGHRFLSTRAL